MDEAIEIFISYAQPDEVFVSELITHLALLERRGEIQAWHKNMIKPGDVRDEVISEHINKAKVILLLISSDFLASNYCFEEEMRRALDRHKEGTAVVIPVLIRSVYFSESPFSHIAPLPSDGRPISLYKERDVAYVEVTERISEIAKTSRTLSSAAVSRSGKVEMKPAVDISTDLHAGGDGYLSKEMHAAGSPSVGKGAWQTALTKVESEEITREEPGALLTAILDRDYETVSRLVVGGSNLNVLGPQNRAPIETALDMRDVRVAALLVSAGAKLSELTMAKLVRWTVESRAVPLALAILIGSTKNECLVDDLQFESLSGWLTTADLAEVPVVPREELWRRALDMNLASTSNVLGCPEWFLREAVTCSVWGGVCGIVGTLSSANIFLIGDDGHLGTLIAGGMLIVGIVFIGLSANFFGLSFRVRRSGVSAGA